jgi:DNA (cytosine-5)-methyltransferase 1
MKSAQTMPLPRTRALKAPTRAPSLRGSVVDLFCGAGGLSHGLRSVGYAIAAGIDMDEACRYPFEKNNGAPFIRKDVASLKAKEVAGYFYPDQPRILVGCAPCQPFSTYNQSLEDPKWRLVSSFADLICATKPDIVSMENVPRLIDFQAGNIFKSFVAKLERAGYHVSSDIMFLPDYGVPQSRSRLVLLASLHGDIALPKPRIAPDSYGTVEQTIGHLPEIQAGEADATDSLHQSSKLSEKNLQRIRASVPGGSWSDWEPTLIADCHKAEKGKTYRSVYGRMRADQPAPTITTQFFGFGNGRFGHPTQDRGLSLREGALLQSFPRDYVFVPPGEVVRMKQVGRMIGNAVPVELGKAIGRSIKKHVERVGL